MRVADSGLQRPVVGGGFLGKLFCLCFLLAPILANLNGVGKFSIGDLAVFFCLLIGVLSLRKIDIFCLLGLFSIIVQSCVYIFFYMSHYPDGIFILARMALYISSFFIFLALCRRPDFSAPLISGYLRLSIIFSALLIVQVVAYHLFGVVFAYIDTPLDIQPNSVLGLDIATQGFRSGGVFKEPSYFATFVAPAVIYTAACKRYWLWGLFSAAIMLSTSSLGFIFIALSLIRFISPRSVVILLPIGLVFASLVLSGAVPILPDRVMETLEGGGSLSIRVVEPFTRVFIDSENLFLPSYEALKDLADPKVAAGIWFNSFTYAVVVYGILVLIPLLLMLLAIGVTCVPLAIVLLVTANGLTNPYFVVSIVSLSVLMLSLEPRCKYPVSASHEAF